MTAGSAPERLFTLRLNMARAFLGAWTAFLLLPALLHADGGTVRFAGQVGGYRVSVFTAPTPLRAGPVDISVLVQDPDTGDPLQDTWILVRLTPIDPDGPSIEQRATSAAATNKLFQAALIDLPAAGRWHLEIVIKGTHGTATAPLELEVAEPLPRWVEMIPWIAWPIVPIVLYGLHQVLSRPGRRRGAA
jgi:hypothetical protein